MPENGDTNSGYVIKNIIYFMKNEGVALGFS
jgi:hypothetical protein